MRDQVAVDLIPVISGMSVARRKLLKATLAISPLPDAAAQFSDRIEEATEVCDFLVYLPTVSLPALPA